MGIPILVLGESGTGKSASLRNFKPDELALVNVAGKPLPFKGKFEGVSGTDFRKIYTFMKTTRAKVIVIDDAQYMMSYQYMRRIKENGWDKFNEIQSDFFNLIDCVKDLPSDTIVYFLSHIETKEDGRQKIKTIGKMLDEKITIEGMFTVVLKTYTADGKYYFLTQNSGSDTTKSPMGMFPSYAIDNDLKYVDEKIRNYYEIGAFLTDEEMAEIDKEAAQLDIFKDEVEGKKRRSARGRSANNDSEQVRPTSTDAPTADDSKPARRRRSVNEDMAEERAAVEQQNSEAVANAGLDKAEGEDGVEFNEVETPELTAPPRRKRRGGADEQSEETSADVSGDAGEENPTEEKAEEHAEESTGETRPRRRRNAEATAESAEENVPMNRPEETEAEETETEAAPRRRRRRG